MLKAIHAQEDRQAARDKAQAVVEKLESMRLAKAATIVREGVDETLSYMTFPREHWTRIRTNNVLERIMREIRRRTRVVGNFPDGTVGGDAGGGQAASHRRHEVGHTAVLGHGSTARSRAGGGGDCGRVSRRKIFGPRARQRRDEATKTNQFLRNCHKTKCAHLDGHYRSAT